MQHIHKKTILSLFFGIFLVCFSLGQLQRIEFPGGAVYLHDLIAIFFILCSSLFRSVKIPFKTFTVPIYLRWLLVAGITIGSSTLIAACATSSLIPVLYLARLALYSIFTYCVWQTFSPVTIQKSWIITLAAMLYLGLLQYIFLPDTRFLYLFK